MESWENLVLYFAICSFLGPLIWKLFEKLSFVQRQKKFLYGPFSVIDGFSVIFVYFFSLLNIPLAIKILSYLIILTILEYSSIIFSKTFIKNKKAKIGIEKINFRTILFWFGLILLIVFAGQQILLDILNKIPQSISRIISIAFLAYLAADLSLAIKNKIKK